jgi:hypothetical protein
MTIHEHLPKPIRQELKQPGWSKAIELVKIARRDGQHFEHPVAQSTVPAQEGI